MKLLLKYLSIFLLSIFLFSGCTLLGPTKAGLQVMSADIPASIFLNGQYLEKTPLINKELKPGDYVLKIEPEDTTLASYETKINLKKGLLTVVTWKPGEKPETSGGVIYEMEKLSKNNTSQLQLISIPDRAIVSVDGGEKDFAPLLIENISAGHHDFEVSLPSFDTQKHTINVLPGYKMLVTVKLAKQSLNNDNLTSKTATETADITATASAQPENNIATKSTQTTLIKKVTTGPKVTINKTGFFVNNKEVLKVRDAVGSTSKELGYASVGNEYEYLGQTQSNWYQINFDGQTGWVSGQYSTLIAQ